MRAPGIIYKLFILNDLIVLSLAVMTENTEAGNFIDGVRHVWAGEHSIA